MTVRDILLSDALTEYGVELVLMDIDEKTVEEVGDYARQVCQRLNRGNATIVATTDLSRALDGARFVVSAIEYRRELYWAMDFHVGRKHGFKQVFGENGGPGGIFHALRNMTPTLEIVREMERRCPDALYLNFTNPEHKLCEMISRLSSIQNVGLCHGVFMGQHQIATILDRPVEELDMASCGMNHFSWVQHIRDRATGEDLYPLLREREREGDWLYDWHDLAMARIMFRRFGLWPSPAPNHYGEYVNWADEFVAEELQYFYDPADGHPWQNDKVPEFVYSLGVTFDESGVSKAKNVTHRPWQKNGMHQQRLDDHPLTASEELEVPIMEGLVCGIRHELAAINVVNEGAVPNLADDMVVEVPGIVDAEGLRNCQMDPLPESIAAMLRLQGSLHKVLVEAFEERSKDKLIQTFLLDPTVNSYRRAVECIDELLDLQKDLLPDFSESSAPPAQRGLLQRGTGAETHR